MKQQLEILNQFYLMEQKLIKDGQIDQYNRFLTRIQSSFRDLGFTIQNPLHEKYFETRTDVEANITGELGNNLMITQVIKPIIFQNNQLVQKGIVIVENV